jgi:uncharacterized protein YbaA (DUF1428 family)
MGYVDLYLLPIREERVEEYREQASAFGAVVREKGALSYREFRADDLGEGFAASAGPGQLLTAAVVEFESRAHRDTVMEQAMADPRIVAMSETDTGVADMAQMRYGGFETFVEA